MKIVFILIISLLVFSITSCKKTDTDTSNLQVNKLQGFVQKGPYINGTSITLYKLNNSLEQLGTSYSSQILDNKGNFELSNLSFPSKYVLFYANGYYYNEVLGTISGGPLQLYGLADITSASSVNINVMTHLERRRVEYLIKQGKSFAEAKKTAQQDILNIFGFQITAIKESEKLDINMQGDENAILLAVSLILQGNLSVGDFSELLSIISADLEKDGKLDNAGSLEKLKTNVFSLNVVNIRKNLENRYQSLGLTASIPNFEKYIQQYLSTFPIDITTGLVAYYPFNGNANDESGNGNNGTVYDATLGEDRFGTINKCYYFNGTSSYIKALNSNSLNSIEEKSIITISSWVKVVDYPSSVFEIVGKYNPKNDGGWEMIYHNSFGFQFLYDYFKVINTTCTPSNNNTTWTHLVFTYDIAEKKYKFYINGLLVCEAENTIIIANTEGGDLYIGFSPHGPDEYSHGYIDDIRLYNRSLTQEQITYLAKH